MFEEESIESMPETSQPKHHCGGVAYSTGRDPFSSPHRSGKDSVSASRIVELESENLRLQRLVAELLIKNQQLRKRTQEPAS
ncbi:hypothetical protein [Edaphobacter aggregans]|uniref:hypothetical protein n=1 Tax=Edaphobacter aggregans TaxID=570835 RepID=UPI0005522913|nr:hypothetical protein [Edaphobacter aggregans]